MTSPVSNLGWRHLSPEVTSTVICHLSPVPSSVSCQLSRVSYLTGKWLNLMSHCSMSPVKPRYLLERNQTSTTNLTCLREIKVPWSEGAFGTPYHNPMRTVGAFTRYKTDRKTDVDVIQHKLTVNHGTHTNIDVSSLLQCRLVSWLHCHSTCHTSGVSLQ